MNNYHKGKLAELIACFYLRCKGYRVIKRNFSSKRGTSAGEIDIVCQNKNTLIFVEVKQRSSLYNAAYSIFPKQQNRIVHGAQCFIKMNLAYKHFDVRFDALLITLPYHIRHIKNAWLAD